MSTRALVNVMDDENQILTTIYVHCDGYPEGPHGLGYRLNQWQDQIVRETMDAKRPNFSGPADRLEIEDLAAMLIWHLKDGQRGNVYIYPPGTNDVGEEHVYTVKVKQGVMMVEHSEAA